MDNFHEIKRSLLSIHEIICIAIGNGEQIDLPGLGSEIERIFGLTAEVEQAYQALLSATAGQPK